MDKEAVFIYTKSHVSTEIQLATPSEVKNEIITEIGLGFNLNTGTILMELYKKLLMISFGNCSRYLESRKGYNDFYIIARLSFPS